MIPCAERRHSGRMSMSQWGEGTPTWIFVHGWLVDGRIFDPLCRELQVQGQILVPDLAGTGQSQPAERPLDLASWCQDVCALVRECPGPVHLLGHSMGGLVAQMVAATLPEKLASLTLVVPVPTTGLCLEGDTLDFFELAAGDNAARRATIDASCVAPQADIRELMHEMAQNTAAEAVVNGLRDWQAGCTDVDLTRISCATIVIGSSDAFLSDELIRREVVDKIPSATMVTMHPAGHYPLIEATASLARIIEEHAFRN